MKQALVYAEKDFALLLPRIPVIMLGAAILSFGMYNIHEQVQMTEGGVFGLNLLLNHWLGLPISILAPVLDFICYFLAFAYLKKRFLLISALASIIFSLVYRFWETFPPLLPDLSAAPFFAAILGGIFVGIGVGLIISEGGSSGGDDVLALLLTKKSGCALAVAYLVSDIAVLVLSLTYIPVSNILYSFIAVVISSFLAGWFYKLRRK